MKFHSIISVMISLNGRKIKEIFGFFTGISIFQRHLQKKSFSFVKNVWETEYSGFGLLQSDSLL